MSRIINSCISWLKNHQHPEGYWGYESVADTGVVILQLANEGLEKDEFWKISSRYGGGMKKAIKWLRKSWNFNNWSENIWDTSVTLRGLLRMGIDENWISRIQKWLENQESKLWGIKKDSGLHHTSQALNTMIVGNFNDEIVKRCEDVVREKAFEVTTPYVAGQVAEALIKSGVNPENEVINYLQEVLESHIHQSGFNESTFQDDVFSLAGLGAIKDNITSRTIKEVLQGIFQCPDSFKTNGCWYFDAKKTAFGLYGLRPVLENRKKTQKLK